MAWSSACERSRWRVMARRWWMIVRVMVLVALPVLISACARPTASAPPVSAAASRGLARATTLEGVTLELGGATGRPQVLFFMAAWCGSCLHEARALAELQQRYGPDRLEVVVVDVDPGDRLDDLQGFRELAGLPRHWVHDRDGVLLRAFQVRALDTTLVFGPDGRIAYRDERPTSAQELAQVLQPLLAAGSAP